MFSKRNFLSELLRKLESSLRPRGMCTEGEEGHVQSSIQGNMACRTQWLSSFVQETCSQLSKKREQSIHILPSFGGVEDSSLSALSLGGLLSSVNVLLFLLYLRDIGNWHKMLCKKQKLGNWNYLQTLGTCSYDIHDQEKEFLLLT